MAQEASTVRSHMVMVSGEFTRPADTTAYTAGDVVSNSTSTTTPLSFPDIFRVNQGSGYIVGIRISTDKKSITPRFRVHFFNDATATLSADNVAFKEVYADASKRLGYYDMPAMTTAQDATNSDMSRSIDLSMRMPVVAATGDDSLYVVLEALDAFTPASGEKFNVMVSIDNN